MRLTQQNELHIKISMNHTIIRIICLVAGVLIPVALFAQGASDASSSLTNITGLTVQQQLYITWGSIALKYLAEFYSSVRNGGGLKRIIMSFWFGENLPKVVAVDYKQELTTPPFNKPSP